MELSIEQLQLDLDSKTQVDEERFCKLDTMFEAITQQLAQLGDPRDRSHIKNDHILQMNWKSDFTAYHYDRPYNSQIPL